MKYSTFSWAIGVFFFMAAFGQGAPYPFSDDFESGVGNWQLSGLWELTPLTSYSPTRSLTDSPGRFYTNNTDASAALTSSLDLSSATNPALRFYHRYALESWFDNAYVEVSTNGGGAWQSTALDEYSGSLNNWTRSQCALDAFVGASDVRIRFRLLADDSVIQDGWFIDDVFIGEAPTFSGITNLTANGPHEIAIEWAPGDASVTSYRLYRVHEGLLDWESAHLVASVASTTNRYTDVTVSPKTRYTYAVMALNSNQLHTLSATQAVTTPAGMDYPFFDDAEGGGATWNATPPWALTTEDSASPTTSWTDSPGTNYQNSMNAALTLVAPVDLTTASRPALCFAYEHDFASGDSGNIELSVNGSDWPNLQQITGRSNGQWKKSRLDLSAYTNETEVLVRFRITTDASTQSDGWHIDNIGMGDSPAALTGPVISEVASHSMRLTWAQCPHPHFARYEIYQSTSSGVDFNDTLVAAVSNRSSTTVVASNLALNTEYFYRVYAVTKYGVYSPDGTETGDTTLNHPYPFAEDFEGSLIGWNFFGGWGTQTNNPYSGALCLSDSPDHASYGPNTNMWALTAVDLSGSDWPVLTFYDRFDLGVGDYALVEVSTDGSSWSRVYGIRDGARSTWAKQSIDLSEWKTASNLRIRLRMVSNDDAFYGDGWNIDAITVQEHTPVDIPVPFHEGFENGLTNWIHAAWTIDTNESYEGGASIVDGETVTLPGDYNDAVTHRLCLAGELTLTNMTNPQLTYWLKGHLLGATYIYFRTQVSTDDGVSWSDRPEASLNGGYNADWTRYQCDLSTYAGQTVRLRFWLYGRRYTPDTEIYIDKITVEERTPDVLLNAPVPSLKSMELSWEASTIGAAFQRYELRRDTADDVDLNAPLMAVFTNISDTGWTNTGLSIGQAYYYRLFVVNTNDTYSEGSERSGTTVPLTLPMTDAMDTTANWDIDGDWGVDSNAAFEGSASLSDSPGSLYDQDANDWMLTAVNLSGSTWPVLTFHDRFDLGAGDYGLVEVSTDGSSWSRVYGIRDGARSAWAEQSIDLSEWKSALNLRVRFRLVGNNDASVGDGWFIDDLSIEEHTPVDIPVPFHEGFENGLTNWIHAAWTVDTNESYEGGASVIDGETVTIPGDYNDVVIHRLCLAGELALTNMTNPQLTYWLKGHLLGATYIYFRTQVSTDDGATWSDRPEASLSSGYNADWTRYQCDLSTYAGQTVRLRFWLYGRRYTPDTEIYLDKITVEERTPDVLLNAPVPSLKSMELSWEASTIGAAFQRYELRRDTADDVDLNAPLMAVFTNISDTGWTNTGLSIGQAYYYRLFVVNTNDTYSEGSERSGTTVPLTLPMTDAMDTTANWDISGDWGIDSNAAFEGSASLSDSPGSLYDQDANDWMLTAVNLSGSTWPVLTFHDRFDLGAGDYGLVEVSTDGSSWSRVYGIRDGARSAWAEQSIDLSEWKSALNLRVRFRLVGNNDASVGDGWFIDDLSIEEHTPVDIPVPFHEGFENGLTNWIHAAWTVDTNESYEGGASVIDGETVTIPGDYNDVVIHRLCLAGELALTNMTNPQLTYWLKGHLLGATYIYFRTQVSTDDGATWTDRPEASLSSGYNADWTRYQCDLSTYAGQTVRLRFWLYGRRYTPDTEIYIDKITVEERPADALLDPLTPHTRSMDLSWAPNPIGSDFLRFELYRDTASSVDRNDSVVGLFTNATVQSMTDTNLVPGTTYYYKLYVFNTNDTCSLGNERSQTTTRPEYGFTNHMESLDQWAITGAWNVDTNHAYEGSGCFSDSPGAFYVKSSDSYALTAVDLTGSDWPVLRFMDRYELENGDQAVVEVSPNGSSWTRLYGVYYGSRTNWREQIVDLSEWKASDNLRIRFRLMTDNSDATLSDGWFIDHVRVIDHSPQAIAYPLSETFESGDDRWLHAAWRATDTDAFEGNQCARDTETPYSAGGYNSSEGVYHRMTLGGALMLTNVIDPSLSFYLKGHLLSATYAYFRTQVSTDGGLGWSDLPEASRNVGWDSDTWTLVNCDLNTYSGQTIRIRFQVFGYRYTPDTEIYIDNIGLGNPAPGAPTLSAPENYESIPVLRPDLIVTNAFDYQGDALDYAFEVYSDATLSNLVASVPVVASGADTTSWTVDTDLTDGLQYWWRCRADDGANTGLWMNVATFYVNHANSAPNRVELLGPPPASILRDDTYTLSWLKTEDPDFGDIVEAYHLQIDTSEQFTNPVVDDATITLSGASAGTIWAVYMPLSAFSGSGGLQDNTGYVWRMRAKDQWDAWSEWSTNDLWFIYGTPPPSMGKMAMLPGGKIDMSWARSGARTVIEFTPSLDDPDWQEVTGATIQTNGTVDIPPAFDTGFFRVRTVD